MITVFLYGLGWIGFLMLRVPRALPGWLTTADAVIYLQTTATGKDEQGALEEIRAWPEVGSALLVSGAEAHERLRKQLGQWRGLLTGLGDDFLQSSIEVILADKFDDPDRREETFERMRLLPGVAEVLYGKGEGDKLKSFLSWIGTTAWVVTALLMVGVVGVQWNVALSAIWDAQDEIRILGWVGAPDWLIRLPFFLASWMVGTCGAIIAVLLFAMTVRFLQGELPVPFGALLAVERVEWFFLCSILTVGSILMGSLGVGFAMGRMSRECLGRDSS
jgi:cell division protein FtsX